MVENSKRPGGELANRPLHFFWIADCSGSMQGEKIQSLNNAIRQSLPAMKDVANENPNAQVLLRAVAFSSDARWHIEKPTDVQDFKWPDLRADGVTDLGRALKLVAKQLEMPPMDTRALPPVLVLISDGQPTDDYRSGIDAIRALPWGAKAVRIAIGIGQDADDTVLQEFIGHNEIKPLRASNADQLTNYIKWASTVVLSSASSPKQEEGSTSTGPALPPPPVPTPTPGDDVW